MNKEYTEKRRRNKISNGIYDGMQFEEYFYCVYFSWSSSKHIDKTNGIKKKKQEELNS